MIASAVSRAAPRFLAKTKGVRYRITGAFFSEIAALIAAVEATHATHLIESGTASGFSTELLARYFSDSDHRLNITTIDINTLYGLHASTSQRLARFTNVAVRLGDSLQEIPRLLDALPQHARAVVFVDGPKGAAGRDLALSALRHPRVTMVGLHDAAPFWGPALSNSLVRHPEHLLLTSEPAYRTAFGSLDAEAGVYSVLQAEKTSLAGAAGGPSGLANMLKHGNGLWLAGRSKLRLGASGASPAVHVALGSDAAAAKALLACVRSLLRASAERSRLVIHVLTAPGERPQIERVLAQQLSREVRGEATLQVTEVPPPPPGLSSGRGGTLAQTALNLARFHLPALLPAGARKVLYLDVDILVLADVAPLVDAVFEGVHRRDAIAVVPRRKKLLPSLHLKQVDLGSLDLSGVGRKAMNFNAGVMVLNLEVWRRAALTPKVLDLAARLVGAGFKGLPGMSTPTDSQSVLNLLFQNSSTRYGGIEYLPPAWNVDGLGWKLDQLPESSLCAARLLHWSGGMKPWRQPAQGESAKAAQFRRLWRQRGGAN